MADAASTPIPRRAGNPGRIRDLGAAIARIPPRTALIVVIALVFLAEIVLARLTLGTADVVIFESFAETVDRVGPIHIYSLDYAGLNLYNHPPLVGWWLWLASSIANPVLPLRFLIRVPSILAHGLSTLLVWQILRRRVPLRTALASALLVAVSPMLFILSGYHGNNDPVVAMLSIAAVYLLVDRRAPLLAGVAFSLAVSVKILPIVVLPLLLAAAWRLGGRRAVARFALGGVPIFVLFWVPVLALAGHGFVAHVLGYNGSGFPRVWGIYHILEKLGVPQSGLDLYTGLGSYVVLALAALVPAWFIWRRGLAVAPLALGLALALFLALSPAWAPQYTSWVGAAVFLIDVWSAVAFTVGVGAVYVYFYLYWMHGHLWMASVQPPAHPGQGLILLVAWAFTCLSAGVGLWRLITDRVDATGTVTSGTATGRHAATGTAGSAPTTSIASP